MTAPAIARDGFASYFAERLWDMIPETYRHEDGIAPRPGVLRALVELMADQAAVLRRSNDRLWEDQFAEVCNDWALPYIADLVGARLVAALDQRARRVVVAKTIHYRRRAGTVPLLEQLSIDVTGWDASVVEQFTRLGRARHLLDPAPTAYAGRVTRTMPGGWADLRTPRGGEIAGGPLDEYAYTPDVRRHRGTDGRFGIPKLAVHLYRLAWYEMIGVTPFDVGGGRYTFDPSGRDIPLFAPRGRSDGTDGWHRAREWDLAAPIRCRVLGDAVYEITEAVLFTLRAAGLSTSAIGDLRKLMGLRISGATQLRTLVVAVAQPANLPSLTATAMFNRLRDNSLIADCGSSALLSAAVAPGAPAEPAALRVTRNPGGLVPRPEVSAASLDGWPVLALPGKTIAVDPALGRFRFIAGALPAGTSVSVDYFYGFSGDIGAGPYDRRDADERTAAQTPSGGGALTAALLPTAAMSRIADSATYTPLANRTGITAMTVVAADTQRPYLRLAGDWILDTGAALGATLTLDGLWIGSRTAGRAIVLRGNYATVTIDRCTIDPGSLRPDGTVELPGVELRVEGSIDRLVVNRSIVGPIRTATASGIVERLEITDSIVQSIRSTTPAISIGASTTAIAAGETVIRNSTVFGDVTVNRLSASGIIITGIGTVTDNQHGCFRFSAAMTGGVLPRRYESFLFTSNPAFAFTSQRFGQPGYAQLSAGAPAELSRGAEDGAEMGAFAFLHNSLKLDGLAAKLEEFMPFGLVPLFLAHT